MITRICEVANTTRRQEIGVPKTVPELSPRRVRGQNSKGLQSRNPVFFDVFVRPAGLEPATSGLEMLTRSAMNRRYLCRFVSSLVSMGTGQEGTGGDNRGHFGSSRMPFGWSGSTLRGLSLPVESWPDRTTGHRESADEHAVKARRICVTSPVNSVHSAIRNSSR